MADVMLNGEMVNFDVAVILMDDDIREEVHREMAPCSEQEFMDAYAKAHHEKYGETFEIN